MPRMWNSTTNRSLRSNYKSFQGGFDGAVHPHVFAANHPEKSLQETITERQPEIQEMREERFEELGEGVAKRFQDFASEADTPSIAPEERKDEEDYLKEEIKEVQPEITDPVEPPSISHLPVLYAQPQVPVQPNVISNYLGNNENTVTWSHSKIATCGIFVFGAGAFLGWFITSKVKNARDEREKRW